MSKILVRNQRIEHRSFSSITVECCSQSISGKSCKYTDGILSS